MFSTKAYSVDLQAPLLHLTSFLLVKRPCSGIAHAECPKSSVLLKIYWYVLQKIVNYKKLKIWVVEYK